MKVKVAIYTKRTPNVTESVKFEYEPASRKLYAYDKESIDPRLSICEGAVWYRKEANKVQLIPLHRIHDIEVEIVDE